MMKFIVVSPMKPFFESHHRRAIFYYGPQQDSSLFVEKPRDLPLRQSSGCMGGDLSAVVASGSRRPRTSECLVKVSSRTVR